MELQHVNIVFQIAMFLLAISFHESAHAWTANLYGDPTGKMLGRVSMNPIRHIDPVGTVLLPLIAALTNIPMLGWAKPVPVDSRNFRDEMMGEIMTSVAGPISNLILVIGAMAGLILIAVAVPEGKEIVYNAVTYRGAGGLTFDMSSPFMPIALLLFNAVFINILLAVFNLIPIPPLDGSHVLRHFLPESLRAPYEQFGFILLIMLVVFGQGIVGKLMMPVLQFFVGILAFFLR